jgi:formate--tetrahydrofolate ligase
VEYIAEFCRGKGCEMAVSRVWEQGGAGGIDLAEKILYTLEGKETRLEYVYSDELPLAEKIAAVATKIYGAEGVDFAEGAKKQLARLTDLGFGQLPVCMAKTQYSLSDNPALLGRPEGFRIAVREVYVCAGAGFVVALTGTVMTMPGLPKAPAAYDIDVNDDGQIVGLF